MYWRLFISAILLAAFLPAVAHEDEAIGQLIARADAAPLKDRPALYAEVARRQLEGADKSYTDGNIDQAQAAVHDVVEYSGKARDAALQSNKKLKNTEIAIREMAHHLRDLKRTLAIEDQPVVQKAIDDLESIRTQLLERMFKKKGEQ